MPHRYFTREIEETHAILRGQEAYHLSKVMRGKCGQEIILCDGQGTDYLAQITDIQKDTVQLELLSSSPNQSEPQCQVTLYVGYPKQDKLEWIIQKGVELGAVRIVPFFSKFCVVQPKKEKKKTSGISALLWKLPNKAAGVWFQWWKMPLSYKDMLRQLQQFDVSLFCYECGGQPLSSYVSNANTIAIVTGSEGGFSTEEAEQAQQAGAKVIGLGPRILRCETAPLAALAATMAWKGQLQ